MTSRRIARMIGAMLTAIFNEQKALIDHFFDTLNEKEVTPLFTLLLECKGTIFFTGVGKSGFIAQKVAATLCSTGTHATYLSAQDALHGDIGKIGNKDVVVFLSKSGETEELLALLPFIQAKGAKTGAILCRNNSRLGAKVNSACTLAVKRELCPHDLAPTTSAEVQLLFADALAVALMKKKGFTKEAFAKNHPGGHLGKRLTLKVKDLMLAYPKMPLCSLENTLNEVMLDFSKKRCGCLVVIDNHKQLQGIFTDGDLRRSIEQKGQRALQEKLKHLMTPSPKAISQEALATEALSLMEKDPQNPITVLPVVDSAGEVLGLIKLHDILAAGL